MGSLSVKVFALLAFLAFASPAWAGEKVLDAISSSVKKGKNNGSVSLGFAKTSGNTDTESLSAKANLSHKGETTRFSLSAKSIYGRSDGASTKEELETVFRAELRKDKWFPFWDFSHYRNPFQKYDYRIATGPGLGYFFLKDDAKYLSGSYYLYYNKDRLTEGADRGYQYYIHNIEGRIRYKFSDSLKFKQKAVYKLTSKKPDDYYFIFETSIVNDITKRLALEVTYESKYQNLPVSDSVRKTDTNFTTSIRYNF